MARQHRTIVSREGWFYLVVLALVYCGAMSHEVNLLLVLGGMLVGPLLFSYRAVRLTLRGMKVRRKLPQGVCAGDMLVARVSLTNTRRRGGSWGVLVEEEIRRDGAAEGRKTGHEKPIRPTVFFPFVPAGQSHEGSYRGRLSRRGRYRIGPIRISTRFPFGLLRRITTVGGIDTLIVFPRLGRLTRKWNTRYREAFADADSRQRRRGPEGDFYGTRQWHASDSRRLIHWRSFARTGELVVRQFEQPRNRNVAVLLDLWQPERPTEEDLHHVELAVSLAATVVSDLCRMGSGNLVVCTGGAKGECVGGTASSAVLHATMEILAIASAHHGDHLSELIARASDEIEPGTEVVLIGTRPMDLSKVLPDGGLAENGARGALSGHMRTIDTSSNRLAEFFHPQ